MTCAVSLTTYDWVIGSLITATIGAVVLLYLVSLFKKA